MFPKTANTLIPSARTYLIGIFIIVVKAFFLQYRTIKVVMSLMLDILRRAYLKPCFSLSDLKVIPQYGPMIIFLFVFAADLVVIGYMLKLSAAAGPERRHDMNYPVWELTACRWGSAHRPDRRGACLCIPFCRGRGTVSGRVFSIQHVAGNGVPNRHRIDVYGHFRFSHQRCEAEL